MLEDGVYVVHDDTEIKKTYFNRMSKELQNYYFKEFTQIKKVVYALNKPQFFENKLNLCPSMKFSYSPNYKPDVKTKNGLDFLLTYYLEVLCSSNKESYNFLLKGVWRLEDRFGILMAYTFYPEPIHDSPIGSHFMCSPFFSMI